MGTINTSMQAVQQAQADLGEVDNLPPLGQDMVRNYTKKNKLFKVKCATSAKIMMLDCCKPSIVCFYVGEVLRELILVQYVPVCDVLCSRRLLVQIPCGTLSQNMRHKLV